MTSPPPVAIVEDDAGAAGALKFLLSQYGMEIAVFASVAAFSAGMPKVPFVLVLDLQLPDGDGLNLLQDLSGRQDIAAIVLTAHGRVRDAHIAGQAGARHFFEKPADPERLVDAIRQAADSLAARNASTRDERLSSARVAAERLGKRTRQVLRLVLEGKATREIAAALGIGEKAVEYHRRRIRKALGTQSLLELGRRAAELEAIGLTALGKPG